MEYVFKKYGIGFKVLSEEDLEWLRQLRMHPSIESRLLTQTKITSEQQVEWFKKQNLQKDFHLVIYDLVENKRVGYCSAKRKEDVSIVHCGSFLDPEFHQSDIAMRFFLAQADYLFYVKNDIRKFECSVLKNNIPALNMNFSLGYQVHESKQDHVILILEKKEYEYSLTKIKSYLEKRYDSLGRLLVTRNV